VGSRIAQGFRKLADEALFTKVAWMAREFIVVKGFIVARGFIPDGLRSSPKTCK
jgi:hypothetical protein